MAGDATFEVSIGGHTQLVREADTYRHEGQLTTFYRLEPGRITIDAWAKPVASFRTSAIESVLYIP